MSVCRDQRLLVCEMGRGLGRGQTSLCHLSGVPLRSGFLPPIGQEGLLVVSHSLKLAVRMFCSGAVHFFWTDHVLEVNTEHSQSRKSNHFTVLRFIWPHCKNVTLVHPVIQPLLDLSGPGSVFPDGRGWPESNKHSTSSVANTSQPHTTRCWQKAPPPLLLSLPVPLGHPPSIHLCNFISLSGTLWFTFFSTWWASLCEPSESVMSQGHIFILPWPSGLSASETSATTSAQWRLMEFHLCSLTKILQVDLRKPCERKILHC